MDFLPSAFDAFRSYKQFIVVKISSDGKKLPCRWDGKVDDAHNPSWWLTSDDAFKFSKELGEGYGIGFVFTKFDPFFFLDIDHCLVDGKWSDLAQTLCALFPGAAVEVSTSRTGLHIFGTTSDSEKLNHACKNTTLGIELYTRGRFVALTGYHAQGNAGKDFTQVLPLLIHNYFKPTEAHTPTQWTNEPHPDSDPIADDEQLIQKAITSRSAASVFGNKARFDDLWTANEDVLSHAFPHATNAYDASSADASLAQHLAFWTGNNCERILRLMQKSDLVRDKWDREDYLYRTIIGACARQKTFYTVKKKLLNSQPISPTTSVLPAKGFLTGPNQGQVFTGCTYVMDEHKVLIPGGHLLTADRFNVAYGGYLFGLDATSSKSTTEAFKAFTQSQILDLPRAHTTCFKPTMTPGSLIKTNGVTAVNMYYPVPIIRRSGNPEPFLKHLRLLTPVERDNTILLSYSAALVQYPGVKFKWCPVIQGVPGNGKTLILQVLARCIGLQYCHFPRADELDNHFNAWMYKKIFIGVDDMYADNNKGSVLEILKPMITGVYQGIEAKGQDQVTREICANFIINSNYKDGLRKTEDDRRFAYFYTPQQTTADLLRDGMNINYFTTIWHWLNEEHGQEVTNEYLHSYAIPAEFNPARDAIRAPETSSTLEAIHEGRGVVEQEILEAVAQNLPGFRGGWISSVMLDRFLMAHRLSHRAPRKFRPRMLETLGYVLHPLLTNEGRTTHIVQPDGCRPRLYVRKNHGALYFSTIPEVLQSYAQAQTKDEHETQLVGIK